MKLDEFGLEAADLRMKLRVLIDAYPERLVARLLKGGSRYISLHGVAELLPQHLQETGAPEDSAAGQAGAAAGLILRLAWWRTS
ncbi:MAG: hypothetical protein WA615_20810 [Bradyrhizobium sp.]|uniref:hypothetical protein n=1 Tax=Bradyrhizobium sp. TaxID=376 RepID=UPI003C7E1FED